MSITSLKSRSSLTPIEDTEVDPLNFMNDFKFPPLNDPGAYSETRNPDSLHENIIATRRDHTSDVSDERHAQDSSSLDQSGTYSQSDTFTTQTIQRPESRIFSNEIYNSSDDRRRIQRTSGCSDRTSTSEARGQSPSVLVVQESRSEHILNTVHGTDGVNDDDEYSMSGFDHESAAENSLDDSGNVITNRFDSANQNKLQSYDDLLKEEEELEFDHDDHQQRLKTQTDYEHSAQMPAANNMQAAKSPEDRIQTRAETSLSESLSSSYAVATVRNGGMNESDYIDPNDETKLYNSTEYLDRTDSVQHSYAVQAAKSSEERVQTHAEKSPSESLSSSYAVATVRNVGRKESDYVDPNDETKLYNSTEYLDRTDSVEHSYFASFRSTEQQMKPLCEISNTENGDPLTDITFSEKSSKGYLLQTPLTAKAGDINQNTGDVSQNASDVNQNAVGVNQIADDVSQNNGDEEIDKTIENKYSLGSSASGENEVLNTDSESKYPDSNPITSVELMSLPNISNDGQRKKIHDDLLENETSMDELMNENHTRQCKNQNDSGVESQEMDTGKRFSRGGGQAISCNYETQQADNMEEEGKAAASESSQASCHLEHPSEPDEVVNSSAEEKDATPDINPESTKTAVGNEGIFALDRPESSQENNISDRSICSPDPQVNGNVSEGNVAKPNFPIERTSLLREGIDNVLQNLVNTDKSDAVNVRQTSTSEKDDKTENAIGHDSINSDADEILERSHTSTKPTEEINPACVDTGGVDNLKIDNSVLLLEKESSDDFSYRTKGELEGDLKSSKKADKDDDIIKVNSKNENVSNEQQLPDFLNEPNTQEIERGVLNDEDKNEECESEMALNLVARSEDSESFSETQEENGKRCDLDIGTMRVTKSSSTLSVKTTSSSSSRISNSTYRSKEENKKLERLLKGPYSEKPTTPRLKGRQKNESDRKKLIKSQEKPKSKPGTSSKKHGVPKLQIHKTIKKNDNPRPNSKKSNAAISAPTDKGETEKMSTLPVKSDEKITEEAVESNSAIVNQRSIYHIKEADTEAEETPAIAEQNFFKPVNELARDSETSMKNLPPAQDENNQEESNNEEKEMCSDDIDSLGIQRSNSESVKQTEHSEENISISSENGKPIKPSKNTGENKSLRQTLLLGKKKIIISSPKTSERLSAKEAKAATPLKSNGNMSPVTVPKRSNHETNRPLTAPSVSKGNIKKADPAMKPTTITVIDETADSPKTNSTAGRIILNNIKINLKKKSMQNSASSKVSRGRSRSPSPEGTGLSSSGPQREGKPAYKTQSMSSLQVPGQTTAPNSWDPPKEEDALSTYSRRPSMDSVSRKSVDYRIRNTTTVIQPLGEEKPKSVFNNDETFIQNAVPCLPLGLAITCLFLNTVLPGSGTALSGVSILCCGRSRLSNKEDQVLNTMCANLIVGLAQLFTVSFLLVGWFWSVGWGIKMVSLSVKRRQEIKQQREKDLQTLALSAFGSPKRLNGFGV